jgi:hypothetical protein
MGLEQQVQGEQGCEEVQRFLAKTIFWEKLVGKGNGLSLVLSLKRGLVPLWQSISFRGSKVKSLQMEGFRGNLNLLL